MKILNEFEREIEFPLVSIFSESLSRTPIPIDWKRAHELPVFKGGDKMQMHTLRCTLDCICHSLCRLIVSQWEAQLTGMGHGGQLASLNSVLLK